MFTYVHEFSIFSHSFTWKCQICCWEFIRNLVQASTANIYPPKPVLHRRNPYFTIIAHIMHYYGKMPILAIFLEKSLFFAVNQHNIDISCQQCFEKCHFEMIDPWGSLGEGGWEGGKWTFLGIFQKMAHFGPFFTKNDPFLLQISIILKFLVNSALKLSF